MTTTQQIFVVFFAIFWGAIASVQGRWKMFQPLIKYCHVAHRLFLSVIVLNVLPILYFAWMFFLLRKTPNCPPSSWSLLETLLQVAAGVMPAFAVFAFYRLWLAIVEISPTRFYQYVADQSKDLKGVEPTIECLNVQHKWWPWNLSFAVLYFLIAILVPVCLVK